MSAITTNTELLPVIAALSAQFVTEPEGFSTDEPISTPKLALAGTEQQYVSVHGNILDHRGHVFARVSFDGGLHFAVRLMLGKGGYSTEILPEDATTETLVRHAERALVVLSRQLELAKAKALAAA